MPLEDNPYYGTEVKRDQELASVWAQGYSACLDDVRAGQVSATDATDGELEESEAIEVDLRIEALAQAVQHSLGNSADDIVKAAVKFYAFLEGANGAEGSEV